MSELNPYAKYLDGRDVKAILAETPRRVSTLLGEMGPERTAMQPAPGKWSPAEIVCHLADCDVAFGFRLRQTLAEPGHVVQPFDQEKWAAAYGEISSTQALAAFSALRAWNLLLIERAYPTQAGVAVTHPERGTMTFGTMIETIAGHDLNHIQQLERLAGTRA